MDYRDADDCYQVSIVIANYNYGQYIGEALESCIAQTYANISLFIVDDASTDQSLDVIAGLRSACEARFATFRLMTLEQNSGKVAALNKLLPLVRSKFHLILDADDALSPDYVSTLIREFESAEPFDPSLGFVYSDCELVSADGASLSRGRSQAFDAELLRTKSYIPECALTLTACLSAVLPMVKKEKVGTKHHKWMRIVQNAWVGRHCAWPGFRYRMHSSNLSGIGKRITSQLSGDKEKEPILSGYWPLEQSTL